ncbi:MAG: hypothetical protein FWD31_13935, partial [Planctomycetaceae bacterium]|nr:hypothetical protein [Planctomycetaceae bacterium]
GGKIGLSSLGTRRQLFSEMIFLVIFPYNTPKSPNSRQNPCKTNTKPLENHIKTLILSCENPKKSLRKLGISWGCFEKRYVKIMETFRTVVSQSACRRFG